MPGGPIGSRRRTVHADPERRPPWPSFCLTQAAADLIDAFNEADWERFRGVLAPDAVYAETGTGRRVEGADAYVALCQGWKVALPDVRGTIRGVIASEDQVAQEILWEGTYMGPMETPGGTLDAVRSADQRPGVLVDSVPGRQGAGGSPLPRRAEPAPADRSDTPLAG